MEKSSLPPFLAGLSDNPYFGAGFGLVAIGSGLALLKTGWRQGLVVAKRQCLVTMEIPSRDKSYGWVLQWIAQHSKSTQHLSVETTFKSTTEQEGGKKEVSFDLVPSPGSFRVSRPSPVLLSAPFLLLSSSFCFCLCRVVHLHFDKTKGKHWIHYKDRIIQVDRQREKNMVDLNSGTPWETVTLTTLGRSKQIYLDILQEAKDLALKKQEGKTVIYTAWGPEWRPFGPPRRRRPLDSVILEGDTASKLVRDVKEFLDNPKWYLERGIPYRRGYLLYGSPGSGKSSFIYALAGHLEYDICVLNLSEKGLTDDRLAHLLSVVPQRSITLLEDVDAAFLRRDQLPSSSSSAHHYPTTVTFSGLLNTLDGVSATEERILFMTTNHIEQLDPALIRPGRVDVKQELGHATPAQMKKMFARFYRIGVAGEGEGKGEEGRRMAEEFEAKLRDEMERTRREISMAQLQGYLMFHKNDPQAALRHVSDLFTST
ncbi:mitochondrial chaperone [Balamuthia mandrillaris]